LIVVYLVAPLAWTHYAAVDCYWINGVEKCTELRAEVGLISRNIRYKGTEAAEGQEAPQYGATIVLHAAPNTYGVEATVGRIAYVEMNSVGQAYLRNRHPILFHMLGVAHESYIRGNSIVNGFNRAISIRGTNNLRVEDNVICDIKGHAIALEDAVERKNLLTNNLVVAVKQSFSHCYTD
jgi:cell migration-inducing and hyaluronan-binding protein